MRFDPVITKTAAFKREIGDFADRIDNAQIGAELQAIDDPRRDIQIDVLRPEITMAVDDAALANAFPIPIYTQGSRIKPL